MRLLVLALLVTACSTLPTVVVESTPQRCEVPAVVTDPVSVPRPLTEDSTVGDLWARGGNGGALETALEKCNARLQDVQKALEGSTPKQPEKSLLDSIRGFFGQTKEPTP